jgi:hypothetical protein
MSIFLALVVVAFLTLAWYLTREDASKVKNVKRVKRRSSSGSDSSDAESPRPQTLKPISKPRAKAPAEHRAADLEVYDLVTETDEACEHIVWFTRCEGDVYEVVINGVSVSKGSGPDIDVAHVREYSSVAMMTAEKIAFPLSVGVNVYRDGQLFGHGERVVRGPGEPLPT